MTTFAGKLTQHQSLAKRRVHTKQSVEQIRAAFQNQMERFSGPHITAYVAGSLGRGDVGKFSDLDLFLLTDQTKRSRLDDLEALACVIDINRDLGYGPFSNDGMFLKVYALDKMLDALGAPQDDSENLFTARMLLLLESQCVCNEKLYSVALDRILGHYFRDSRGKRSFRPLFLLNDILRYWRTLCLNYELIRDVEGKPWRKKNINLKFSRMLTVFGTVLPLVAEPISRARRAREIVQLPPHERFARGLDSLGDTSLLGDYQVFLDDYESFLTWKEQMGSSEQISDQQLDQKSRAAAKRFSGFIHRVITHSAIDSEFRRFLVL